MKLEPKRTKLKGKPYWVLDMRSIKMGRIWRPTREGIDDWILENAPTLQRFGSRGIIPDDKRMDFIMANDLAAKVNCPSLLVAVQFWADHAGVTVKEATLQEAAELFIRTKESAGRRDAYIQNINWTVTDMKKHFGPDKHVHAITLGEIQEWADTHPWNLGTRRRMMGNVTVFLNFCKRQKWLRMNVLDDMERITEERRIPVLLTLEQCKGLLKECHNNYRRLLPHLAVQLFAGLRYEECMNRLTKDHFKSTKSADGKTTTGFIDLEAEDTKMRQRRLVPIHETLASWLEVQPFEEVTDHERDWTAMKRAVVNPWPHNAIRHTSASYLYYRVGAAEAARILGHTETVLHNNYKGRITDLSHVEAFWGLKPGVVI